MHWVSNFGLDSQISKTLDPMKFMFDNIKMEPKICSFMAGYYDGVNRL